MALTEKEIEKGFDYIIKCISKEHRSLVKSFDGVIKRDKFYAIINEDESKRDRYARACEDRQEALFDEILDIADEKSKDTKVNEDGVEIVDHENIQRSRLRIDARKWALAKMNPKKYGDKIDHTVDQRSTITVNIPDED